MIIEEIEGSEPLTVGDPGFHKGGCIMAYFVNLSFENGFLNQALAIM